MNDSGSIEQRYAAQCERVARAGHNEVFRFWGQLENDQGHPDPALESFRHAEEILAELVGRHSEVARYRRDLAVTLQAMAALELDAGRHQAAREHAETAQKHFRRLVDRFPDDPEYGQLLRDTDRLLEGLKTGTP